MVVPRITRLRFLVVRTQNCTCKCEFWLQICLSVGQLHQYFWLSGDFSGCISNAVFNSFSDEKIYFFQNTQDSLLLYHFYHIFYPKYICGKLFRMSFCDNCLHMIGLYTIIWYLIRYFYTNSSASQIAQQQRVRLIIHGSRVRIPAESIFPFQYHVELIPFPPKTAHFVHLKLSFPLDTFR